MSKEKKLANGTERDLDFYIALMRGINVGGKNLLPMSELTQIFKEEQCFDVRTYIQSGNVIFRAAPALAAHLASRVSERIQKQLALAVPVVLRALQELERVVHKNPFLISGVSADFLHVMFLADMPQKAAVASLNPKRSLPDEFVVLGREIYLHCPRGIGRTKLTNAWFDSQLATTSTVRNWRTVLKLIELAC